MRKRKNNLSASKLSLMGKHWRFLKSDAVLAKGGFPSFRNESVKTDIEAAERSHNDIKLDLDELIDFRISGLGEFNTRDEQKVLDVAPEQLSPPPSSQIHESLLLNNCNNDITNENDSIGCLSSLEGSDDDIYASVETIKYPPIAVISPEELALSLKTNRFFYANFDIDMNKIDKIKHVNPPYPHKPVRLQQTNCKDNSPINTINTIKPTGMTTTNKLDIKNTSTNTTPEYISETVPLSPRPSSSSPRRPMSAGCTPGRTPIRNIWQSPSSKLRPDSGTPRPNNSGNSNIKTTNSNDNSKPDSTNQLYQSPCLDNVADSTENMFKIDGTLDKNKMKSHLQRLALQQKVSETNKKFRELPLAESFKSFAIKEGLRVPCAVAEFNMTM